MPIDDFGFSCGWIHGFAIAGCAASRFSMIDLVAAGFDVVCLAAGGLAVVGFKQCQVHCPDAA